MLWFISYCKQTVYRTRPVEYCGVLPEIIRWNTLICSTNITMIWPVSFHPPTLTCAWAHADKHWIRSLSRSRDIVLLVERTEHSGWVTRLERRIKPPLCVNMFTGLCPACRMSWKATCVWTGGERPRQVGWRRPRYEWPGVFVYWIHGWQGPRPEVRDVWKKFVKSMDIWNCVIRVFFLTFDETIHVYLSFVSASVWTVKTSHQRVKPQGLFCGLRRRDRNAHSA